jgi:hypothetical protein
MIVQNAQLASDCVKRGDTPPFYRDGKKRQEVIGKATLNKERETGRHNKGLAAALETAKIAEQLVARNPGLTRKTLVLKLVVETEGRQCLVDAGRRLRPHSDPVRRNARDRVVHRLERAKSEIPLSPELTLLI